MLVETKKIWRAFGAQPKVWPNNTHYFAQVAQNNNHYFGYDDITGIYGYYYGFNEMTIWDILRRAPSGQKFGLVSSCATANNSHYCYNIKQQQRTTCLTTGKQPWFVLRHS
jgi:hypothetical protein